MFFDPLENDTETINNSEAYPLGDQLVGNTGNIKCVSLCSVIAHRR